MKHATAPKVLIRFLRWKPPLLGGRNGYDFIVWPLILLGFWRQDEVGGYYLDGCWTWDFWNTIYRDVVVNHLAAAARMSAWAARVGLDPLPVRTPAQIVGCLLPRPFRWDRWPQSRLYVAPGLLRTCWQWPVLRVMLLVGASPPIRPSGVPADVNPGLAWGPV